MIRFLHATSNQSKPNQPITRVKFVCLCLFVCLLEKDYLCLYLLCFWFCVNGLQSINQSIDGQQKSNRETKTSPQHKPTTIKRVPRLAGNSCRPIGAFGCSDSFVQIRFLRFVSSELESRLCEFDFQRLQPVCSHEMQVLDVAEVVHKLLTISHASFTSAHGAAMWSWICAQF